MADIILVTGGASSGKSVRAEAVARSYPGRPIYIATAEIVDDETAGRIAAHRERRGQDWELWETPLDLAETLARTDARGPRLVECLTVWLSNLMYHGRDWAADVAALTDGLSRQTAPVILVSNEVGLGIVPDNALAREFRRAAGHLNQEIAARANTVEFVVAGLPLRLK
jgi:adenosylcobinamide kinase/adenosylcobinamide-phosphate guanylyltransferase